LSIPVWAPLGRAVARGANLPAPAAATGNFQYIYGNEIYRNEFYEFLVNVFHLYPEIKLHNRIKFQTESNKSDRETYLAIQSELDEVKPALGDLTYALPALGKQKRVMAGQTRELLDNDRRYEGYLEIGSTGRYIDALEEKINIEGDRFMVASSAATYSITDMLDRGQINKAGTFIDLNNYATEFSGTIPDRSIDLVTVYIGFHHCPLQLRGEFLASIRDSMKPGGYLIVRDHDARDEKMLRIVALAHDIFNMGTNETWNYNEAELRHFYSLATLDKLLHNSGFRSDGRMLFQQGDPTLNALMVYRKA